MLKTIRYVAWSLVAILCAVLAYAWFAGDAGKALVEIAGPKIGGPFTLVRADGGTITDKDIEGKPHAIFFGFANCPEVCPTTLFEAAGWLANLGPDADRFGVYFITVDPERDTPEMLAQYMTSFPGVTGMTGPRAEIDKVLKEYRVYAKKVPLDGGGYTMDHTATVYLMDANGNFAGTIAHGENPDIAMKKIRNLIGAPG